MNRNHAVLAVVLISSLVLSCLEKDDNPVLPDDEGAPSAEILRPADGDTFAYGEMIMFVGTGVDPQDGLLGGESLVWKIGLAGYLGTGDTIETDTLPSGQYTVKLTVTDSDGKSDSDRISIFIESEGLSLRSVWPNGDGNRWRFQYETRMWDSGVTSVQYWPTLEEVPAIPSMEELEDLLRNQPIGDNYSTGEAEYTIEFAGDTTTASGVTAQNLRETFTTEQGAVDLAARPEAGDAFLARLCAARPDLVDKLRAEYPRLDVDAYARRKSSASADLIGDLALEAMRDPLLVHGYAWEKTDEWIGTYGDVDRDLAWKFLESDLNAGHQFVFQLLPSLVDDIYLHCRILRTLTAHTAQGTFDGSLECLYAIDYGTYAVRAENGEPVGYTRCFEYGSVIFSPGIGPVYSYERFMLYVGDPPTLGIGDLEISLIEADIR